MYAVQIPIFLSFPLPRLERASETKTLEEKKISKLGRFFLHLKIGKGNKLKLCDERERERLRTRSSGGHSGLDRPKRPLLEVSASLFFPSLGSREL